MHGPGMAAPTDSTTTVAELKTRVLAFVRERDWEQFHSPKNLSMALAAEAGELMMMPPTVKNLQFLGSFETVDAVMDAALALPPPVCILPKIRLLDGKLVGVVMPGEPGYDEMA